MDSDSSDEREPPHRPNATENSSDSESVRSSTRSRGRSRGRSRRGPGSSPLSGESEPELQQESTPKTKDQSRGRSRDRRRPSPGRYEPRRRSQSMIRPPSMDREPSFSFEQRSRSLDRSSEPRRKCKSKDQSRGRSRDRRRPSPDRFEPRRRSQSMIRPPSMDREPFFSFEQRESPGPDSAVLTDPVTWTRAHSSCSLEKELKTVLTQEYNQQQKISSSLISGYKRSLEERCEKVNEGLEKETQTLKSFYTEPLITEDLSEEDDSGHERPVHSLFKPYQTPVRVVLTRGEAGMGKTVSAQKFTLDWAQGSEHQELELVLPLSFRELNLVRGGRYSLMELIHTLHPSLEGLTAEELNQNKVLFIFDSLDESLLPLNFSCEVISEVTQRSEVMTLFTNLIKGHLLPDALIWITSRPTAANQIPVQYVDRYSTISGFTSDQQKEQFFRRRFRDEEQCGRVLSFIKSSHTLWSMCQSPVFCWITATALEHRLQSEHSDLPSLTELFVQFLLVQMHMKKRKYKSTSDFQVTAAERQLLLKLGKLAFKLLQEGHALFDQEDLQMEELDQTEALIYSGLCTEVFTEPSVIFPQSGYSFVHPNVQKLLAAVYVHRCINNQNKEELMEFNLLHDQNTPLQLDDFLHELSLEKKQRLLGALNSGAELLRLPPSDQNYCPLPPTRKRANPKDQKSVCQIQ